MPETPAGNEIARPEAAPAVPTVASMRVVVGLLQGVLLTALYFAWAVGESPVLASLLMLGAMLPVLLVSSLGHLAPRRAAAWMLVAACIILALGLYDTWRADGVPQDWDHASGGRPQTLPSQPSALLYLFCGIGLYIGQVLVLAGTLERRLLASYPTYFDTAWKLAIQLLFSTFFVGALWFVMWLGAILFALIGLDLLKELLVQLPFICLMVCLPFAYAMHLTDVRPALVRGIRTLLLVLLSWILPVATLIAAGFVVALPFTGLEALWGTHHATAMMLGTAAALVLLINAAYQNGEVGADVARLVAVSARVAATLLLPIWSIGVFALALRVEAYGWTAERVAAAACLLVAGCYAVGYCWAARPSGRWLQGLGQVNVATAIAIPVVLLALFSPLADPARLSVNNQVARLGAGKVGVDRFDFGYLRFASARYGREALARLNVGTQGANAALIRQKAASQLTLTNPAEGIGGPGTVSSPQELAANIDVYPASARLPDTFLLKNWSGFSHSWSERSCLVAKGGERCDAFLIDFDGDGKPEVLLFSKDARGESMLLRETARGEWINLGALPTTAVGCEPLRKLLEAGAFSLLAPQLKDLEVGGQRIEIRPGYGEDKWEGEHNKVPTARPLSARQLNSCT